MSDAPAAQVTENGVPPVAQDNKFEEAPGFKVFAGNLAYSTTDDGLKAFFAPVQSDILSAQVILRGVRSAGYGFVALASEDAARKAVELLDKKELDGRQVIVEIAKPADQKDRDRKQRTKRRPGRRGARAVPGEVTEAEAAGTDAKPDDATPAPAAETPAKPKKKKKKNTRKNKATASYAEGDTETPAEAVTEGGEASKKIPRPRKPRTTQPPRPAGEDPVGEPSKSMLFVANLGFNVDDDGLRSLFTDAGIDVVSARIIRRRFGHPRRSSGYGFVDVSSEEEQQRAIQLLQGKDVGGREIAVKVAVKATREDPDAKVIESIPAPADG